MLPGHQSESVTAGPTLPSADGELRLHTGRDQLRVKWQPVTAPAWSPAPPPGLVILPPSASLLHAR